MTGRSIGSWPHTGGTGPVAVLRGVAVAGLVAGLVGALAVGVTGCGGAEGDAGRTLAVRGAWARPTPPGAASAVVYLTLTTDVDDVLVDAEVSPSVAGDVELHATTRLDAGGGHVHGGAGGDELLSMGQVESFPVDAGEPLVFEPGGNHLMLVDLAAPLTRGQRIALRMRLASGRSLEAPVVVADNPPR